MVLAYRRLYSFLGYIHSWPDHHRLPKIYCCWSKFGNDPPAMQILALLADTLVEIQEQVTEHDDEVIVLFLCF